MSKLKVYMALSAEGPIQYENRWEFNLMDMANALSRWNIPYDDGIIESNESDIFFDFDDLKNTQIRYIHCFQMIDFDVWISFVNDQCISTKYQCDTMGIISDFGHLPAKCIEIDSYINCFVSMYICPFYDDQIPSEKSFDRFFQMIKINDSYDIDDLISNKNRYNTYNQTEA